MAHFLPHRRDSDTSGHAPRAGVKSQTKSQGTMAGRSALTAANDVGS